MEDLEGFFCNNKRFVKDYFDSRDRRWSRRDKRTWEESCTERVGQLLGKIGKGKLFKYGLQYQWLIDTKELTEIKIGGGDVAGQQSRKLVRSQARKNIKKKMVII